MSTAKSYVGPLQVLPGQSGDGDPRPEAGAGAEEDKAAGAAGPYEISSYVGPLRSFLGRRHDATSPNSAVRAAAHADDDAVFVETGGRSSYVGSVPQAEAGSAPRAGAPGPGTSGDILEAVHAKTIKVMHKLRRARHRLQRLAAPELQLAPAIRALLRTERRLGRPLRVAICGEVNAGKSSLANLLAGIESLPTAVISNTLFPTLLYYAAEPEIWMVQASGRRERLRSTRGLSRQSILRIEVGLPSPRLAAIQILDMPGFADPQPGAPVVSLSPHHVDAEIWCTVSTQAWKESERCARGTLPRRLNTRSLLVATHTDLLQEQDRTKLLARLREEVGETFTDIILLSTLEAIAVMGREGRGGAAWTTCGAGALESALAALLMRIRERRATAAMRVTGRVAQRALARIERGFTDGSS